MSARDNFTEKTKHTMCLRVGARCSKPECRQFTVGPNSSVTKATIIGVAAHITAAAPGGPRFDASLTAAERQHITNGIWLCATHAALIDKDEAAFPVKLLRQWKQDAEDAAAKALNSNVPHVSPEYEAFVEPYLKIELDNTFCHFGATVSYDAWTMSMGIVVVRLTYEGDVDQENLVTLGNFAVRAYLKQHLTHMNYMQMLTCMKNNRLQTLSWISADESDVNFDNFRDTVTSIDWSAIPMPDDLIFDAIAGVIGDEFKTFLFDLTPFWAHLLA